MENLEEVRKTAVSETGAKELTGSEDVPSALLWWEKGAVLRGERERAVGLADRRSRGECCSS